MIAIVNRTESNNIGVYGVGLQYYTLQINTRTLCDFFHNFEDGLSACLYQAYVAACKYEEAEHVHKLQQQKAIRKKNKGDGTKVAKKTKPPKLEDRNEDIIS